MGCMLFVDAIIYNMLDSVGSAFKLFNDLPWARVWLTDFSHDTSLFIRLYRPSRKDVIADRVNFRVRSSSIDMFSVPGAMMVNQCLSDGPRVTEKERLFFNEVPNGRCRRVESLKLFR